MTVRKREDMRIERGSARSHCVQNWLVMKETVDCRKADCGLNDVCAVKFWVNDICAVKYWVNDVCAVKYWANDVCAVKYWANDVCAVKYWANDVCAVKY